MINQCAKKTGQVCNAAKWPFLLLLFLSIRLQAQPVFVRPAHSIYQFLDRLESAGKLSSVLLSTRPLSRSEIAAALNSVNRKDLNAVEQQEYSWYAFEFQEKIENLKDAGHDRRIGSLIGNSLIDPWLPDYVYANRRNLLSVQSESFSLNWDPLFLRRALSSNSPNGRRQTLKTAANGFRLWGTLLDHVGVYLDIRDTKEWGGGPYSNERNYTRQGLGFVRGGGNHEYHDETVAYVSFSWKNLLLFFGKDVNLWGPGYRGQLALSANPTSYDMLKIQFVHSKVKFTFLVGFLKNYNPGYFYGEPEEKQIAAHRVEFAPFSFLELGMHETVVFSGRKFEPAYYNPFMFYRSAEHYLGDRDNATMGLDFELKLLPRSKLYGELFIDDITTTKLGTGYYGNKYAYTLGGHTVDIFGIDNLDLRLEFTRTRPYLYTHKNDLNSYGHFSSSLGHWMGPNSEALFVSVGYRFSRRLVIGGYFEQTRHGANSRTENTGGDITMPHNTATDPYNVNILAGNSEKLRSAGVEVSYEVMRYLIFTLSYSYTRGEMALYNFYLRDFMGEGRLVLLQMGFNY